MKIIFNIIVILILATCSMDNNLIAQNKPYNANDPSTWRNFRITANIQDDTNFVKIENEMGITPYIETVVLTINLDENTITFGDENSPDAIFKSFTDLPLTVQDFLKNFKEANKIDLDAGKITGWSVYTYTPGNIKTKGMFKPPRRKRDIISSEGYINPYFQAFGGDPLGIPIKGGTIGLSFNFGTPYSGPMETDYVGASVHLFGAKIGITTRIKEFVWKRSGNDTTIDKDVDDLLQGVNGLYAPHFGLSLSYVIPFGNYFELTYFQSRVSGDTDPPIRVKNETGEIMKNNVIIEDKPYWGGELRYPLTIFQSTRSKAYIAYSFDELHMGFVGREMILAGQILDLRADVLLVSPNREFQILIEGLASNLGEGFASTSFAIGPSVRFSKRNGNGFGINTLLLNLRIKLGDFYSERY